jgi:hypothetical protein
VELPNVSRGSGEGETSLRLAACSSLKSAYLDRYGRMKAFDETCQPGDLEDTVTARSKAPMIADARIVVPAP